MKVGWIIGGVAAVGVAWWLFGPNRTGELPTGHAVPHISTTPQAHIALASVRRAPTVKRLTFTNGEWV